MTSRSSASSAVAPSSPLGKYSPVKPPEAVRRRDVLRQAARLPKTLLTIRRIVAEDCEIGALDEHLGAFRGFHLGAEDPHYRARQWRRVRLGAIAPRDVAGLGVWELAFMVNVAREIEEPILEYSHQNGEGFRFLLPSLARFLGKNEEEAAWAASQNVPWCESPWCAEERRHAATFARIIERLTASSPASDNPNRPKIVTSSEQDAIRLVISREAAEWNSSSTYAVMAAHATGDLHHLFRNVARDEIKHLSILAAADRYLFGPRPWRRFADVVRESLDEYRAHKRRRSAGDLMGTNPLTAVEVVFAHVLVESAIRRWTQDASAAHARVDLRRPFAPARTGGDRAAAGAPRGERGHASAGQGDAREPVAVGAAPAATRIGTARLRGGPVSSRRGDGPRGVRRVPRRRNTRQSRRQGSAEEDPEVWRPDPAGLPGRSPPRPPDPQQPARAGAAPAVAKGTPVQTPVLRHRATPESRCYPDSRRPPTGTRAMSKARPPWWMYAVLIPCTCYFLLVCYSLAFGPQTPGLITRTHPKGFQVRGVQAGLPAARAGLEEGDIILSINGLTGRAAAGEWDRLYVGKPFEVAFERGADRPSASWTLGRKDLAFWTNPEGLAHVAWLPGALLGLLLAWLIAFRRPDVATARLGALLFASGASGVSCSTHRQGSRHSFRPCPSLSRRCRSPPSSMTPPPAARCR